jgi:hypothetical protein
MSTKLALLKSGETIISDIKELVSGDTVCGYLFKHPHRVEYKRPVLLTETKSDTSLDGELQVSLSPWIILSADEQIPISTDWVVTIVEPVKTILELYEEKVNGQSDQVPFTEEQSSDRI